MVFLGQTQPTTNTWPLARPNSLKATGLASSANALYEKALYETGRSLMVAYTRLMLDVDIQWRAALPEGPKILAPNHPTTTDPLYLLALLSEPAGFVITAATFDIPGVGAYLRATGHVPAIRGSGGATVDAIANQVEAGRNVVIFPEGALSPLAGGFHRPHSGVARVALRTGAPVIPVGIGLQRDRIRVTEARVDGDTSTGLFYPSGPYAMTVGGPLYFEGDAQDRERTRAVAGHIMNHIRNLAHESQGRIDQSQAAETVTLPAPAWLKSPVRSLP